MLFFPLVLGLQTEQIFLNELQVLYKSVLTMKYAGNRQNANVVFMVYLIYPIVSLCLFRSLRILRTLN